MEKDLPGRAERFLFALSNELDALSSHERDTVLLELRGHLLARGSEGGVALDEALLALGSPRDLAAAFGQRDTGSLSRVPAAFALPHRRMGPGEVVREVRATFMARGNGLLTVGLVLLAAVSASSFLTWSSIDSGDLSPEGYALTIVQILTLNMSICAGYRIVLFHEACPWRVDISTFRFVTAMFAIDIATAGIIFFVHRLTGLVYLLGSPEQVTWIVSTTWSLVLTVVVLYLTIRVQPWLVGLATARRRITLYSSWKSTSGWMFNILLGWAIIVLPLYLIGVTFHLIALKVSPANLWLFALAVGVGIVSSVTTLGVILLNATIYRWSLGEAIPPARRSATAATGSLWSRAVVWVRKS